MYPTFPLYSSPSYPSPSSASQVICALNNQLLTNATLNVLAKHTNTVCGTLATVHA